MVVSSKIRTDLALEARERFGEKDVKIRGVEIREERDEEREIFTTRVEIRTENAAKTMGKPQGTYITMEAGALSVPDEGYHREISEKLAQYLRELLQNYDVESVLVAGLGNRQVTPDSLGPCVVDQLHITRHIIREYGKEAMEGDTKVLVSGIVPGVMAQTGMETLEIVQAVAEETKPDVIVAVDALAARSMKRLNRTIQLTDTGITPGSGVGNHRQGLNEATIGIPVIGIGIPTVVDAATIVYDSMASLLEALDESDRQDFLEEMMTPSLYQMHVAPKDIDETIRRISYTVSEGLNLAFREI